MIHEISTPSPSRRNPTMTTTPTSVKDPICGMKVSSSTAIFTERDGKKFYFCGEVCRKKFMAQPTGTTPKEPSSGGCCT